MEDLNKFYKEFGKLMMEVTRKFKEYSENEKMVIEFQEGRVSALINACYLMDDDIPEKLMDALKDDFKFYKRVIRVEE